MTQHADLAAEHGRTDAPFTFGMQFWIGVDDDREAARRKVAERMSATYQLPFERFERYTPFGTPGDVAEALAPFVDAGCRTFHLLARGRDPIAIVDAVGEVKRLLVTG